MATSSIAARMAAHLETEEKRKGTSDGVPFWFYYLTYPPSGVCAVERGWMNQSILVDGAMPPLNKVYSPL